MLDNMTLCEEGTVKRGGGGKEVPVMGTDYYENKKDFENYESEAQRNDESVVGSEVGYEVPVVGNEECDKVMGVCDEATAKGGRWWK